MKPINIALPVGFRRAALVSRRIAGSSTVLLAFADRTGQDLIKYQCGRPRRCTTGIPAEIHVAARSEWGDKKFEGLALQKLDVHTIVYVAANSAGLIAGATMLY